MLSAGQPADERTTAVSETRHKTLQLLPSHLETARGWGHGRIVHCVSRSTSMSKSLSKPKTFVVANAIYSHNFAGHNALANTFVATYEDSLVISSVVGISRNQ